MVAAREGLCLARTQTDKNGKVLNKEHVWFLTAQTYWPKLWSQAKQRNLQVWNSNPLSMVLLGKHTIPWSLESLFHSGPHHPHFHPSLSLLWMVLMKVTTSFPCYFVISEDLKFTELVSKVVWRGTVTYSAGCLQPIRDHRENDILVWLVRKYSPLHVGVEIKADPKYHQLF